MAKIKVLKIEHTPMHCPICKERFMNLFGQPLPNHAQLRCITQNGDEMDIGICENCVLAGVSMEMVAGVLEGIKDYWEVEISVDKKLKNEEKKKRIAFHRSHKIADIQRLVRTGKEAEQNARRKGDLM